MNWWRIHLFFRNSIQDDRDLHSNSTWTQTWPPFSPISIGKIYIDQKEHISITNRSVNYKSVVENTLWSESLSSKNDKSLFIQTANAAFDRITNLIWCSLRKVIVQIIIISPMSLYVELATWVLALHWISSELLFCTITYFRVLQIQFRLRDTEKFSVNFYVRRKFQETYSTKHNDRRCSDFLSRER